MNNNYVSSIRASDGSIIRFECHDALHSTSKLAKAYAKIGYPDRYVVFAERLIDVNADGEAKDISQKGIYMSCILRPSIFPSQASHLRALCASATASALSEHTKSKIGIGWISTIYCESHAIGEISIEGKLTTNKSFEYVIINFSIALSDHDFPQRVTSLIKKVFGNDNSSIPMIMAKDILNKFASLYSNIKNSQKYMDIYRQRFALRGVRAKYLSGEKKHSCKIIDVDTESCALIIEDEKRNTKEIYAPSHITIPKNLTTKKRRIRSQEK
jgi:BirA family biotin operon repressor/biotin-[acetyl-CoA-carboxylase] ligase